MSEIQYPINGSCQCGQVKYRLLSAPRLVVACHCRECQKLSTSAFSITAMVAADQLVLSGELHHWERLADSGNRNCAKFCPGCGNRIYHYNPDAPGMIKLKPTNLDDTRMLAPQMHVWVSEKMPWFEIPADVPQFSTQPPR